MPKILVIDDDEDLLVATQLALEAHGLEVETAVSGQEGVAKLLSLKPDLLILDVIMDSPYEGFEVARSLRERHRLTELPIIMLSNIHSLKEVPYRFAPDEDYLPVDVFIDKPIEPEALVSTVKELLGELRQDPRHTL